MEYDGEESEGETFPETTAVPTTTTTTAPDPTPTSSSSPPADATPPTTASPTPVSKGVEIEGEGSESDGEGGPSEVAVPPVAASPSPPARPESPPKEATPEKETPESPVEVATPVESADTPIPQTVEIAVTKQVVEEETWSTVGSDAQGASLLESVGGWLDKKKASTSSLLKERARQKYTENVVLVNDTFADGSNLPTHLRKLRQANINLHTSNKELNQNLTSHSLRVAEGLHGKSKNLTGHTEATVLTMHRSTRNLAAMSLAFNEMLQVFPYVHKIPEK